MVAIVSVYESGLIRAMQSDGNHWNRQVANEVMVEAIALCPTGSTHVLASSHYVEQNRTHGQWTTGWNVSNDARHALWVHNGTGIYGPRGTMIVPVHTEKKMFMHAPPGMGFRWKLTTRGGIPIYDPTDPYGHLREHEGQYSQPWLAAAGRTVGHRHGA